MEMFPDQAACIVYLLLQGIVEEDETYIGGKVEKTMTKKKMNPISVDVALQRTLLLVPLIFQYYIFRFPGSL